MIRLACLVLIALVLAGLPACTKVKQPTTIGAASQRAAALAAMDDRYLIGIGDELEVVFFHTPELNLAVPVRPDGYISVPFANDVRAAGRTTEELRTDLVSHYGRELESPEIAVIVKTFLRQKIHIGGEVDQPGVYPLEGPMTVMDAILMAGVITRSAKLNEIVVIRRDPKNQSYMVIPCNMEKVMKGTDMTQNIALAPYDAIVVPTSTIADVNTFVDMWIRQNIPVDFGIRFNSVNF